MFISKIIQSKVRHFNLEKVSKYVISSCYDMRDEYVKNGELIKNDENIIRNVLLEEFLNTDDQRQKYGLKNYKFTPENLEHYSIETKLYSGRTDIRVSIKSDFCESEAYYIIECKRIDGSSPLNKAFVKEGVMRFTSGKYSSFYNQSCMLGFVVKEGIDLVENAKKIIDYQKECSLDSSVASTHEYKINDLHLQFIKHFDKLDLNLEYLFFDFASIIE